MRCFGDETKSRLDGVAVGLLFVHAECGDRFRIGLKRIRAKYPALKWHASEDHHKFPSEAKQCWLEMSELFGRCKADLRFKLFSAKREVECFSLIEALVSSKHPGLKRIEFDYIELSETTRKFISKHWTGRGWPMFQAHRKKDAPIEIGYVDYRLYFGRDK